MTDDAREGPYRGLTAYTEDDAEFFFGRDREIDLVIANLKASRLTLLYGESGVGKSSVLLAGVMRRLHGDVARNLARHRADIARGGDEGRRLPLAIALFRSPWSAEQPLVQLMGAIHEAVSSAVGEPLPDWEPGRDVVETLRAWTKRVRTILVVLDQFEEYFVHHDDDKEPETVAGVLPAVVNDVNLRVNFLLSIREDSLAKLDRFKKSTPILSNILRINFLDDRAAQEAIELPLERYTELEGNGDEPYRAEPELVKEIIQQVQARNDDRAQPVAPESGSGAADGNGKGVDTPVLQLVLTRLWEEEQTLGSRVLRLETFNQRLESTARIMRSQLERVVGDLIDPEQDIAAACFRQLVTQSGSKFAQTVTDLSVYAGAPPAQVEEVLKKLAEGQILRSVQPRFGQEEKRYEILHDALGETVLAWTASHLEQRAREEGERKAQEQTRLARRRAIRRVAFGLLGLLIAAGVVALVLYQASQTSSASEKKALAEARAGAADARALISQDPHLAMIRALESLTPYTAAAETALREAVAQSRLRFLDRADEPLLVVAASPDGKVILGAGERGVVRLLRPATGTRVSLPGHKGAVRAAALDPRGTRAVTGGDDKVARVWDVATGKELAALKGHRGAITAVAFGADRSVLTAGADGTARIWDASGRPLATLRPRSGGITIAAFSPDKTVIATGESSGAVHIWKRPPRGWRTTDKASGTVAGHGDRITTLAFSRNGRRLATASADGRTQISSVASGDLVHDLRTRESRLDPEGKPEPVVAMDFNRDGTVLATAAEKTLRFWDVRSGTQFQSARAGADWLTAARFRRDGRVVMTAGDDGVVRLWEVGTGLLLLELRGHTNRVVGAAFLGDGQSVVTAAADGTARIWSVSTGRELRGLGDWVQDAEFAPGEDFVYGVSADGYVFKWDVKTGKRLWNVRDENGGVKLNGVAVDPDGEWVVSAGDDGVPSVWNPEDGEVLGFLWALDDVDFVGQGVTYPTAADPRGGGRLTTGHQDGKALVWTIKDGNVEKTFALDADRAADGTQTHPGGVLAIAYSPRGDRIATAGADQTVRIWNSDTHKVVATFARRQALGPIGGVAYHPEGTLLATASEDGTVRIWRPSDRKQQRILRGAVGPLRAVAFSGDGRLVAAGGTTGQTYVWDWQREALIASFKTHADLINSIAFARDGRILTASDDWTAKLSTCPTCGTLQEVAKVAHERMKAIR